MLDHIISKARQIVKDAQNTLPIESAAALEGVYGDLVNLNNLLNQKLNNIENDKNLNVNTKRIARREIKLREVRVKKREPKVVAEIETVSSLESGIMQMFNLVKNELDNLRRKELPLSLVKTPTAGTDSLSATYRGITFCE